MSAGSVNSHGPGDVRDHAAQPAPAIIPHALSRHALQAPAPTRDRPPPSPRKNIAGLTMYVGGAAASATVVAKLNSNESGLGTSPHVVAAIRTAQIDSHRYPDAGCSDLRRDIGLKYKIDPKRIVCGNGSDELIGNLCLAYGGPGTETIMNAHSFTQYDRATRLAGGDVVKVPERSVGPNKQQIKHPKISPRMSER